ncbi:MAG: oligosaccharide flippase family protein [Dorea sp.]|nr:oligosaccharide flippase family protein [Dorea sp.]
MNYAQKLKFIWEKAVSTGFGHIFGANTINQVFAFASNFILIRVLSKGEYGIYSYAFNIYSFFALAIGFGMESACMQVCSEKLKASEDADRNMRFGILFGSGFNLILGVLIVLGAMFIPLPLAGVREVLWLFALMPLVTSLFNLAQTYFRYHLMNAEYSKCSVLNTGLILIGSVAGAVFFQTPGLIIFREAAMLLTVFLSVWIYRFPLKRILTAARISVKEKLDMLKLAAISMLNIATGQLLYLIDVFLIGVLISDELIVASYKTATIVPNALLFIPTALVVYIYPYFAQNQDDKGWVRQKYFLVLKYFGIFNLMISLMLIILAPLIIRILFGAQYLDAVAAFRILSLSYFFSATFRKTTGNLLVTQRKLHVNFWIGVMEGVLNIVSNWFLIQFMGAVGAAVTTLVICIVSSAVSVGYFITYLSKSGE